jgi:hypothetical protein
MLGSVLNTVEDRDLSPDEIGLLASLIVDEPDHYTVLGVDRDAPDEEIQSAYRLAVECFHPAKRRDLTESDGVMHWKLSSAYRRIEEAFSVLARRSRREVYDDKLTHCAPSRTGTQPPQGLISNQTLAGERWPTDRWPPPESYEPQNTAGNLRDAAVRRSERRRVARMPLSLPLRVTFDHHWQELTDTSDVSPLGTRFRLSRRVEPGSLLRLEMPMPKHLRTRSHDDELYVVSAFVIYANQDGSGRDVVAEFV